MNQITSFTGEYDWLSNFYPCKIKYHGYEFLCLEGAYQLCKLPDEMVNDHIKEYAILTGAQAKKKAKLLPIREDFHIKKYEIMRFLISLKFQDPVLKAKLINTGDCELIEGNWWGDTYWGICNGNGHNYLGKILMELRSNFKE